MDDDTSIQCELDHPPSKFTGLDGKSRPIWMFPGTVWNCPGCGKSTHLNMPAGAAIEELEKITDVVVVASRKFGKLDTLANHIAALIVGGKCTRDDIEVISIVTGDSDSFWNIVDHRIAHLTLARVSGTLSDTEHAPNETSEDESSPIQARFDVHDVKLVMGQTGASKKDSIEALWQADGDLVNAIMALTT
jgi:NACalpha-BTF3-like transcription factor